MLLFILGISVFWFTPMFATAYLHFSHGKERIKFTGKKLRYSVVTVSFIISFTFILFFWKTSTGSPNCKGPVGRGLNRKVLWLKGEAWLYNQLCPARESSENIIILLSFSPATVF
ncbi:MAG: hypothetical protein ACOC5A_01940 [Halanaerobiales bacterium]